MGYDRLEWSYDRHEWLYDRLEAHYDRHTRVYARHALFLQKKIDCLLKKSQSISIEYLSQYIIHSLHIWFLIIGTI